MRTFRGWGLWVAALLAAWPLVATAARTPDAAAAADPLISPEEMLSVDQVRPGMKGVGKSVFRGTRIEEFPVTVLGVLRKMDFDGDMILIRIDGGYPVTSGSGVSQGMSGSPIFVEGRLIGALAFAWPFAREPVAGVTPIAQMLENYRPGAAPRPPDTIVSGDLRPEGGPLVLGGHTFSRATVVSEAGLAPAPGGDRLYLAPVATPVMLSGMGRAGVERVRRRLARWGAVAQPGPGHAELPPDERPRIEPGAAVGVELLGGDVNATAIGTVTWVRGEHVVAFGHPMFGLGSVDLPMTTAFVHGVISSQEVSFKLGSAVERVGTISQDRNWSIGGRVGACARTVPAEFQVADVERGTRRTYRVEAAVHRDLTAAFLYDALLNAVGSVSPPERGTTRAVVEVWPRGLPPIRRENLFSVGDRRSAFEQLFADPFSNLPVSELLTIMETLENNSFGAVPVERVRVSVEVSEQRRTATIERAYTDRNRVRPGERVKIGVVIQPLNAPREVREFDVEVPRNIPGGRLQIGVAGGGGADRVRQFLQIGSPVAKTLPQLIARITDREQNSDLTLEVAQPVMGVSVEGRELPNLPNVVVEVLTGASPTGIRIARSHLRQVHSTPWVLSGAQLLSLQVDADEKDKAGAALQPGAPLGGGITSLADLFRLGVPGDLGEGGTESGQEGQEGQDEARLPGGPLRRGPRSSPGAGRPRPVQAAEPKMPSFEELERILAGEETGDAAGDAPAAETPVRKGLARPPGVWRHAALIDFAGGRQEGVLISSKGELALAPEAVPLLSTADRLFWAQASEAGAPLYVGGWLDAGVERIDTPGGASTRLAVPGEVAVTALAGDGSGGVYGAAEPSGTIYHWSRAGERRVHSLLPDTRVWALLRVGQELYAGTGSDGRLYRIHAGGRAEVVFTAPDRHILALAADPAGGVYCGTYPRGKVYRVREGAVTPIYEVPAATVTALACDAQGNLFIGTSPRATVVRVAPNGEVRTLFLSPEKHVLSLMVEPDGSVVAAMGAPGRVYRIAPDRTAQTLWDPQAAYVLSLSREAGGGFTAVTAGPSRVVRLAPRTTGRGTFTSTVLNAGAAARWGVLRWQGAPAGVEIRTRSGSTAYPDSTWSDWSAPAAGAGGSPVASPPGQYLQYQVTLSAKGAADRPLLRSLELFYRARNRAPALVLTSPAAGEVMSGTRTVRWAAHDPDRDRLQFDLYAAPEGTDRWIRVGGRLGPAGDPEESEEAAQPEGAEGAAGQQAPLPGQPSTLARRIPVRGSTWAAAAHAPRRARRIQAGGAAPPRPPAKSPAQATDAAPEPPGGADESEEPEGGLSLVWDTRKLADGRYRLRLTATDAPTSPDEPATAEALTELLVVDNLAPRLLLPHRLGSAPPALVPVRDGGTYVASAEYRVDGGAWIAAAAGDGIFDSRDESVRIDGARLPAGKHVLEVRARDAAGNEALSRIPYRAAAPAARPAPPRPPR